MANLKRFYAWGIFLSLLLTACSSAPQISQGHIVKYFGSLDCDDPNYIDSDHKCGHSAPWIPPPAYYSCQENEYQYPRKCNFSDDFIADANAFIKPRMYYEVYYENDKLLYANEFVNVTLKNDSSLQKSMQIEKGNYLIERKYEYDSNGRVIRIITNPDKHQALGGHGVRKTIYGGQIIEESYVRSEGNESFYEKWVKTYKNDLLVKRSLYGGPNDKLWEYTLYDHKAGTFKLFNGKHQVEDEGHLGR
jgi:hypothetical protein